MFTPCWSLPFTRWWWWRILVVRDRRLFLTNYKTSCLAVRVAMKSSFEE